MASKETVGNFMVFTSIKNFRIPISSVHYDFTITEEAE
jgi:hypothetical protein